MPTRINETIGKIETMSKSTLVKTKYLPSPEKTPHFPPSTYPHLAHLPRTTPQPPITTAVLSPYNNHTPRITPVRSLNYIDQRRLALQPAFSEFHSTSHGLSRALAQEFPRFPRRPSTFYRSEAREWRITAINGEGWILSDESAAVAFGTSTIEGLQ